MSDAAGLPVLLLTDFGLEDDFAGVCHAVVVQRAPGSTVVHLTHGILPQNVRQGAIVLRSTLPYTPRGVHVAIVDPGVGTSRHALALQAHDGRFFVGPDNGLLMDAVDLAGGVRAVHSIESAEIVIAPVSPTFHGRDVFAPAAAHLAAGGELTDLGPPLDPARLVRLDACAASVQDGSLTALVGNIDRYGNLALEAPGRLLDEVLGERQLLELHVRGQQWFAEVVTTFAQAREGALIVYVDSYDCLAVAINHGDAAEMLRVRVGDPVSMGGVP